MGQDIPISGFCGVDGFSSRVCSHKISLLPENKGLQPFSALIDEIEHLHKIL
jgi:hypothetical protein